ncbi:uncharacterized protein LOC108088957 [Drosophila ficusphila]|uniref:uncharacterized protein LOC108088957 n=1 Tax=Drosophila ficusphila TaxID=30025 RepID=UPI0007E5E2DF|nr:uncharacterized protein LOC108088957 [Drosophila ficusphila]XP_017042466.1 uncharacterized protein LOC108088957 [Drosophila ficusphila]
MICLSRLVVINLPSVWPPTRSKRSKRDYKTFAQQDGLRDFQRPLQFHTKRGYIKWFNKLSHCKRVRNFPSRMHPRL